MTRTVAHTATAWELIGFDGSLGSFLPDHPDVLAAIAAGTTPEGTPYSVRVQGGRTLYEAVGNDGGDKVRLARLDTSDGLRAVVRYVDHDTTLEVVS